MSRLSVQLFGVPHAQIDGAAVTLDRSKMVALLAYLAINRGPHMRGALALLLWPDSPNARVHLRGCLHRLHQALGSDAGQWLESDGDRVALRGGADCQIDVIDFCRRVEQIRRHNHAGELLCPDCRAAALEAVALYRADLLAHLVLRDCPEFDVWLVTQREHLRQEACTVLAILADTFAAEHAWDLAIEHARHRLALDPLDEAAHRKLMLLYAQSDRRTHALRQYEECARILQAELDVPPDEETEALLHAIRNGSITAQIHPPVVMSAAPPATAPWTNLPAALTHLVGREADVQAVTDRLRRADARLLTLTGPGGVGKTSLALAVARALLPEFADGVLFVSLAPIRDPALIAETILRMLDLREHPQLAAFDLLRQAMRDKTMILLLDNFEHVLSAAPLVAELLSACPRLKIMATSREPLRLYGEMEYAVPRLACPPAAASLTLEAIAAHSAVQLLAQRAQAVRHDFAIDQANAVPVAQICRRLDGLPLAIELAAARLRHFTPQELLDRFGAVYAGNGEVSAALTVLRSDLRNIPDRHRSLWETIAWSYDLLAPHEQQLFRRLAVFVGGWTVETAQAVCGGESEAELESVLWSLLDKHLICRAADTTGAVRFAMLETLRDFGLEALRRTGELLATQRAMAATYAAMAEHASRHIHGPDSARHHAFLSHEADNLNAAIVWIDANRDADLALRLGAALLPFANQQPRSVERITTSALRLAAGFPDSAMLADTCLAAGYSAAILGKREDARRHLRKTIEMDEAIGHKAHPEYIGVAYGMLAWHAFDRGDYAGARSYFDQDLTQARASGNQWRLAMTLMHTGILEGRLGNFTVAEQRLDESMRMHRQIGDVWAIAKILVDRATLHVECGQFDQALRLLDECEVLLREVNLPDRLAHFRQLSGLLSLRRGDCEMAARQLEAALRAHRTVGHQKYMDEDLLLIAELALAVQLPLPALCLLAAHGAYLDGVGLVDYPRLKQRVDSMVGAARTYTNVTAADAAWLRGLALSQDAAVDFAQDEVLNRLRIDASSRGQTEMEQVPVR